MWLFPKKYRYEVFISHEVEVRAAIADELRTRLANAGLAVWYSGDQLVTGEDLHKAIEDAIEESRFGLVIFTNQFIVRQWPLKELAWLEKKEKGNVTVVLPVLHNMTVSELAVFSPKIASKYWVDARHGLDHVTKKILKKIDLERRKEKRRRQKFVALTSFLIFLFIFLTGYVSYRLINHRPSREQIESVINKRINDCVAAVDVRYANELISTGLIISQAQIDSVWLAYDSYTSRYRNEYEFNNDNRTIRGRGNVEDVIRRDPAIMHNQPGYGLDSASMYWVNKTLTDGFRHSGFSLLNKRPPAYTWEGRKEGSLYAVDVTYKNEIRFINVSLTLPSNPSGIKRHEMTLMGFAPLETYYFEEGSDGVWYFKENKIVTGVDPGIPGK